MKRLILAAVLLAAPAFAADEPQLDLEQKTMLRCSAVFALIAHDQQRGDKDALAWPALSERGKEYFVQASHRLIEAHKLTEAQVDALYRAEIKRLMNESATSEDPKNFVKSIMQPCLLSLDASGI